MRDPPPHPDLKIGQTPLTFVKCANVLVIWLQDDLKWDTQVEQINQNANKGLLMWRS